MKDVQQDMFRVEKVFAESEAVIEYLLGSPKTLQDAAIALNLSIGRIGTILVEADVYCCTGCGWWSETDVLHEVDGEYFCSDCKEENNV